ncbi:hypothetical protein ACFSNA_18635 [Pedobacter mendelii]|uniref:hypothetical protein n=1 Tax=Pedobacter mendelii TaxID=1908240 RepID=UPI00361955CA
MNILTSFLTKIQTFNLLIVTKGELKSPIKENGNKPAYSLTHETQYYDSFTYKSEIRVLKDMALIDLLSLDEIRLRRELDQLKKLKERFKLVWTNFHEHYSELRAEYPRSYIFSIRLQYMFIVNNLQADHADIYIGDEFVESLNDSLKIRDKFLSELVNEIEEILNPRETFEEWKAKQKSQREQEDEPEQNNTTPNVPVKIPYNPEAGLPKFNEVARKDFLKLLKDYFLESQYSQLSALINNGTPPDTQMIFNGQGNQLADAFKQLYEANLIVGCNKTELEKWIIKYFLYNNKGNTSEYTEGWISTIISSDKNVCKSPILDVVTKDKVLSLVPTVRNKKNNKY